MAEKKENRVCEEQVTNLTPKPDTLTYHGKKYRVRNICDGYDNYIVSVEELEKELLDGIRNLDPYAFELSESICCYCTEEEIGTLSDEELIEIILD